MNTPGLIVGLGNPGKEYRDTRHNAGFTVVERLAARWGARWEPCEKFFAETAEVTRQECRWRLVKPVTFMNLSGECVGPMARFYRVPHNRLLIVVDDADLDLGVLRLRPQGSAGGHHGIESIIRHLGSPDFPRLKLGIARPDQTRRDIAGHVLGRFEKSEMETWEMVLDRAVAQIETWTTHGVEKAMNLYNGPVRPAGKKG